MSALRLLHHSVVTCSSSPHTRPITPYRLDLAYPGQVGVNPIPVKWGATTAQERGPILASRQKTSLGLRNAIGAYNGSYSIYHALSVAIGALDPNQRPSVSPPNFISDCPSDD